MGKNKAQKEAEARAKAAEAERTAVGSDNPQAIQEKMDEAVKPPITLAEYDAKTAAIGAQPAAPTVPASVPATQTVSKQQLSVMKLTVALREQRQIELTPEMLSADGKYILINISKEWPVIRIGTNGGVSLPEIASYKEGMETWTHADALLARKLAREAKKVVTPAPATEAVPAA